MGNEWQGKERRRFPRISDTVQVSHRVLASLTTTDFVELEQKASRTWTKDFSCGGVCIRTGRRLPAGTVLELVIEFPGHPVKAVGKVVWSKELDTAGEFYAGVEFIAMDQNQMDEMAQTVAECLIETYKPKDKGGVLKLKDVLAGLFTSLKGRS